MPRPKKQPEPVSAIWWDEKEETWRCTVTAGTLPDGSPDRRHLRNKDRAILAQKVLAIEATIDKGLTPYTGRTQTLAQWLTYWLENIAPLRAGYSTIRGTYRPSVVHHLIPCLGQWPVGAVPLDKLNTFYLQRVKDGWAPKTVAHCHTTLKLALDQAVEYGYATTNIAKSATPPTVHESPVEPLNVDEVGRLLDVISTRRNALRWHLALLGLRQGEALGAQWKHLDLDARILSVVTKAQRRTYQHGCKDPLTCAAKVCRTRGENCPQRNWAHGCSNPRACASRVCNRPTYPSDKTPKKPCPRGCTGHARGCPERVKGECTKHKDCSPCPPGCAGHAAQCPERVGGVVLVEPEVQVEEDRPRKRGSRRRTERALRTKTPAGTRRISIPSQLVEDFEQHQDQQNKERDHAGNKWTEHGLLFCTPFGRPIDPSRDWAEWAAILEAAGIPHLELHGARHTAATFLLQRGVDRRVVLETMGWGVDMTRRYQHVPDELLHAASDALYPGSAVAGDVGDGKGDQLPSGSRARKRA